MRIIEFMDMQSTKFGGLGRFFVRLMKKDVSNEYFFVFQKYPRSKAMVDAFTECGAKIIVIDTIGKHSITHIPAVYKLFRNIKPDIVHFHFANGFFFFAPLAKLAGVKHLFKTQHCCITTDDMQQVTNKNQLSLKTKLASCNGKVYNLFDKIIMCGKYVQDQFVQVYGPSDKYELIYFGVEKINKLSDEEQLQLRKKLNIQDTEKVICTIAFADPVKGIDILIKSLPYITDKHFKLVLVGLDSDLPLSKEYRLLAEQLGVRDKIIWIGITDDVGKYLSISNIYCQPSRSEALGLAVLEAKSIAIPILASNTGGLLENSEILFQNEDFENLASKLSSLLNDEQKLKALSLQSYKLYTEKFDINIGVQNYYDMYNKK